MYLCIITYMFVYVYTLVSCSVNRLSITVVARQRKGRFTRGRRVGLEACFVAESNDPIECIEAGELRSMDLPRRKISMSRRCDNLAKSVHFPRLASAHRALSSFVKSSFL